MRKIRHWDRAIAEKRLRKMLRRTRRLMERRAVGSNRLVVLSRRNDRIIRMLAKADPGRYTPKRKEIQVIPRSFDLVDNPEETIIFLSRLAKIVSSGLTKKIQLDYRGCGTLGLATESMVSFIVKVGSQKRVHASGFCSDNDQVNRLHWGIGTPHALGFAEWSDQEAAEGRIRTFTERVTRLDDSNVTQSSTTERIAQRLINHLRKCLVDYGLDLTEEAQNRLARYFGEITQNAEQHAGLVDYSIRSYLDNHGSGLHHCHIVIYNFGRSIADSFAGLSDDSDAMKDIAGYITAHANGGFFHQNWDRSDLITLAALQEYVSSKNSDASIRRGAGTVEFIEFFQTVYEHAGLRDVSEADKARMCLISGNTQIIFDGKYRMKIDPSSSRKIIAFNESNDLGKAPDGKYVKHLEGLNFPGTIISIRFPLSRNFLQERSDGKTDD